MNLLGPSALYRGASLGALLRWGMGAVWSLLGRWQGAIARAVGQTLAAAVHEAVCSLLERLGDPDPVAADRPGRRVR